MSKMFQSETNLKTSSVFVIIFYAIVLGLSTYGDRYISAKMLNIADYAVTFYFICEIIIRYRQVGFKNFCKDKWNVFDIAIVALMLAPFDSGALGIIRLFRIFVLFSHSNNLRKITQIITTSFFSIANITLLIFVVFYIYAYLGHVLFGAISDHWENIFSSLLTLFKIFTFEGWIEIMDETTKIHPYSWIYFVSFLVINSFVLFNLFVALIIEKIGETQNRELKEELEKDIKDDNELMRIMITKIDKLQKDIEDLKAQK